MRTPRRSDERTGSRREGTRGLRLLALALLFPLPAHAVDIYYVGASAADCEATTIAGALALAEATAANDEIRLTRSLVYSGVEVTLVDRDPAVSGHLTIRGGYDDCLDTTASGRTTLTGDGSGSLLGAVETGAVAQRFELTLRDLELTGSGGGAGAWGNVRLLLEGALIQGNSRGVTTALGAEVEIGAGTILRGNVGTLGGGAYCSKPGTRLIVAGEIRENEVSGYGGGVLATEGCVVELRAGAAIEHNFAEQGGGLALADGAWAEGGGAGVAPVRIAHNSASLVGGGILLGGPAPRSLLGNVQIESNSAEFGGGVYVEGAVRLQLERFNFEPCANPSRCVTLSHNRTTAANVGFGSAALVSGGGELLFAQGFIEGNEGDGVDDAVLVAGVGSTILLDGVQIWDNETDALFFALDASQIVAGFVSAAGNNYFDEDSGTLRDSAGARASQSSIELYTSILTDHGPFETEYGGTIVGDCLMVDTEEGIVTEATMVGVDPRFRNAAAGDLHLRPDSPAIDSCDTKVYAPLDIDFDLDARGYDTATRPNLIGPFDRGADESPLLFADGFESGNTSAWSSAVP